MTSAATTQAPPKFWRDVLARADPLKAFELRCWARALLWCEGELDLHEAVDELQANAVRDGLVASIGQAVLAKAFGAVRDDAGSDMMPDALPEPRRVPLSTLLAAEYLARENDPTRLRAWLTKHSARERVAIHKHLRGRR